MQKISERFTSRIGSVAVAAATALCLALSPAGLALAAEEDAPGEEVAAEEAATVAEDPASDDASAPDTATAGVPVSGSEAVTKIFAAYDKTNEDVLGIEAALKGVDIPDEYALQAEVAVPADGTDIALLWNNGSDLKQLRTQMVDSEGQEVELQADMDDQTLWFYVPDAFPMPLEYNIKEMTPNYLELAGALSDADLPESRYLPLISGLLLNMAQNPDVDAADKAKDEIKATIASSFSVLDATAVTDDFDINGETVTCEGYQFNFDNKFVAQLLKDCRPAVTDFGAAYWNAEFDQMTTYSVSTIAKLAYGMMILQAEEIPQTWTLTVYVYDDELAAIELDGEYTDYKVVYNGGDFRTQNSTAYIDGEVVSKIEGAFDENIQIVTSTTKDAETGEDVSVVFLCDLESGEYQVISSDDSFGVEGVMAILSDELSFTAAVSSDDPDLNGTSVTFIKVADTVELPALSEEAALSADDLAALAEAANAEEAAAAADADTESTDDPTASALEAFKARNN